MSRRLPLLLACLLAAAPAARADDCPRAELQPPALPHTRAALATNQPVVVLAIGSSSTQGWMSTDIAHSYPAVLQHTLNQELAAADFSVINRGIGGQDAAEEVPRIYTDVIAAHPQLVIWQVGANGALRRTDPAVFRQLVEAGVTLMKSAGEDVILMDNQRSPRLLAAPDHAKLEATLADIAGDMGVGLFARGKLMDEWQKEGVPYDDFVASDGLHMNDRGYRCLAQALAQSIVAGLHSNLSRTAEAGR